MEVFVDSSALLALLDADEPRHAAAAKAWRRLLDADALLISSNYVLVEAIAVAQRRFGVAGARSLLQDFAPLFELVWVDQELHSRGIAAMLAASRRHLSLVDCVSFELMRARGLTNAFTLDRHFSEQGFTRLP